MGQYYTLIQTIAHCPASITYYSLNREALYAFETRMKASFEAAGWVIGDDYYFKYGRKTDMNLEDLVLVLPNIYVKKVIE